MVVSGSAIGLITVVVIAVLFVGSAYRVTKAAVGDIPDFVQEEFIHSERLRRLSKDGPTAVEEHRVQNLPGLSKGDTIIQYAGHVLADPSKGGYFFYWLFETKTESLDKPIIIWLNGGPGCSSMDGLWLELGPFRLGPDGKTVNWNKHSWHNVGNLVFVDQPVGTGLSFTSGGKEGLAKNDETVNLHFYTFLTNFFALHERFVSKSKSGAKRTRPIIFTGESHAGHYIPSLVKYIYERNEELSTKSGNSEGLEMVVQGIALGNPWIDPANQYNPAEFAHGLGLLSTGQVNRLKDQERQCHANLREGKLNTKACMSLLDNVIDSSSTGNAPKVVMYDVRQFSSSTRSFPPGHEGVEAYLNRADVKRAIHATRSPNRYVECADPPYFALAHQDGKGVTTELVYLLDRGLDILIYSGQYDLICNHLNMEKVLDSLAWSAQEDWVNTQPGVWIVDGKPAGYVRKAKNLQSLLLLDAGHMVPMDQPEIALLMLRNFAGLKSFATGVSKVSVAPASPSSPGLLTSTASSPSLCHHTSVSTLGGSGSTSTRGSQRQLLDNVQPGSRVAYFPVLLHASPFEHEVFLRLRTQPVPSASTPSDVNRHHYHSKHAWEALLDSSFYLLVEPGDRVLSFNRAWLRNTSHHHIDLLLTGLEHGVVYTVSLHHDYDPQHLHLPLSFSRSIHLKVGCFVPGLEQCCGRGDCVTVSDGAQSGSAKAHNEPQCKCDTGYSGTFCEQYAVQAHVHAVDHGHASPHSPRHSTESGSHGNDSAIQHPSLVDAACALRVSPGANSVHLTLSSLPSRASMLEASKKISASAASAVGHTDSNTESTNSSTDCTEETCCFLLHLFVQHTVLVSDSNAQQHSRDYLMIMQQRLQDGLPAVLSSLASSVKAVPLTVTAHVDAIMDKSKHPQHPLQLRICGPSSSLATSVRALVQRIETGSGSGGGPAVEVKRAHDVYVLSGPVRIANNERDATTAVGTGPKPDESTTTGRLPSDPADSEADGSKHSAQRPLWQYVLVGGMVLLCCYCYVPSALMRWAFEHS